MSAIRVAVVGSGPAAFYAADHLLKQSCAVDMFEKLPTPFGLVRGGVAPDHQKIKSVTKVYDKIALQKGFRFFGNVEIGKDIRHAELQRVYHAIVYAVGAQSDRQMGIPGEDLAGSHAATEFVAWYNGHPDFVQCRFDLSQKQVAVVGNGNVAMDVVRILASSHEELARTDIADYALEALRHSQVREIYLLGRRGPAQAAFTNTEIKELGEMAEADILIAPDELELDPLTQEFLAVHPDTSVARNLEIMKEFAWRAPSGRPKRIIAKFLVSPDALAGTERVESMVLRQNILIKTEDGSLRPKATDRTVTIPVGLVFRSIGYKGVPVPDLPFDEKAGIIPNVRGRVMSGGVTMKGAYVAGWIKRGPSGVIGTNKPDGIETANAVLEDAPTLPAPTDTDITVLLKTRGTRVFSYSDWQKIDQIEQSRGASQNRPRVKFTTVSEMWNVLH